MRNLGKSFIALAAVSALGICANAQSLQEAIAGGKVSGEIRSTSVFSSNTEATAEAGINNNANSGAMGLQLNYETGSFNGFKAQVGFQMAKDLELHDTSDPSPVTGENEPRSTAEGSNLYLANISYATGNTNIKVGKQLITSPLIAGSNTFVLRDSFHGLSVTNKDLSQTEIRFYVIKDWYERYHAENGNAYVTHYDKPLYSLYFKNKSIERLTLTGQYLTTDTKGGNKGENRDRPVKVTDAYSTYFGSFDYKLTTSFPLSLGAFYAGATFDEVGEDDAKFFGVKVGTKIANVGVKLAYTSVADDNDFPGALGHVPNFFKYNGGQMFTDNIYAGLDSASVLLIPSFGIKGVKTLFSYSKYTQSDEGKTVSGHDLDGASELQADLRYKFDGAFKGLSTRLQIALIDYNDSSVNDDKLTTSRVYLNYKF